MPTIVLAAATISQPMQVGAGSIVTVMPASGATATVEYTTADDAAVRNNVATWAPWAKGLVSAAASDLMNDNCYLRVTATGGAVTVAINDKPSAAAMLAYRADWGGDLTAITNASGSITRLAGSNANGGMIQLPGRTALPKWRAAMGKMRNGERNARLAIFGSSSVVGYGANGAAYAAGGRAKNFVSKLTAMLNSYYAPASCHGIFGSGNAGANLPAFDPRIQFLAGWSSQDAFDSKPLGVQYFRNTTTLNAFTFTPDAPVDSFQVYCHRTSGSGTFTLSVDGGATLATVGPSAGTEVFLSTTVTTTLGAHTLYITPTILAAGSSIHAIRAWDSTKKQIEVFQWGHSTWTAADASTITSPSSCGTVVPTYAPDLCVIAFATNAWLNGANLATFKADTQALIDICKAAGSDVILMSTAPTAVANTSLAVQQQYVDAYAELAVANGLFFIDLWRRFPSYEDATVLGMTAADSIHQAGAGYGDFAPLIFKSLTET